MSNYLQRVIAAGGRTSSLATPPPPVPTVIPAAVVPALAHPLDVQPTETESASAATNSGMSATVPVPAINVPEINERVQQSSDERPTPSITVPLAPTRSPSATPVPPAPPQVPPRPVPLSVAIARMTSATRIRAPKGLRPSMPMPPVQAPKFSSIEGTNLVAAVTPGPTRSPPAARDQVGPAPGCG